MTTEPLARRRQYLLGKARPNAIIGRNRENGELLLLLIGGALGLLCGLVLPWKWAQVLGLICFPALAFAIVYVPFRKRTFYKWFEINRSYRRVVRGGEGGRGAASGGAGLLAVRSDGGGRPSGRHRCRGRPAARSWPGPLAGHPVRPR